MRYAIFYTPPAHDPLALAAASWLGRNVYSGEPVEPPPLCGFGLHEIAYYTAVPRRSGFHACLKSPFQLQDGIGEAALLRAIMRFAGTLEPFNIPRLEIGRIGDTYALVPGEPCSRLNCLASAVVEEFNPYGAALSEHEIERANPDRLTAAQFDNLHRFGQPFVMEEFRFHMPLTGSVDTRDFSRFEKALHTHFDPLLEAPVAVTNLALFIEREPGAPFVVHSLHPMGRVAARRSA
ncbi:MAG: DUF1045 domain-containing protein [Allorhizobium sp.]